MKKFKTINIKPLPQSLKGEIETIKEEFEDHGYKITTREAGKLYMLYAFSLIRLKQDSIMEDLAGMWEEDKFFDEGIFWDETEDE